MLGYKLTAKENSILDAGETCHGSSKPLKPVIERQATCVPMSRSGESIKRDSWIVTQKLVRHPKQDFPAESVGRVVQIKDSILYVKFYKDSNGKLKSTPFQVKVQPQDVELLILDD